MRKKTMSNSNTLDHVSNDKKVLEYSQLCFNCGITTIELMNQTEMCKATKSFECSACSFKCCTKNNLEYHMENDHKISINYAVTSDSKKQDSSKSINNSSNKKSPRSLSKSKRNILIILLYFLSLVLFMTFTF